MLYQLFGGKTAGKSEELNSKFQRKSKVRRVEDWNLDSISSSALRMSTLSSSSASSVDNILPFGQFKVLKKKKLGIYSSSKDYCSQIKMHINVSGFDVVSFTNCSQHSVFGFEQAHLMDAWLIHMLDEDENPWLDVVLDIGAAKSSLFLSEKTLSSQCFKKIEEFMLQAKKAS